MPKMFSCLTDAVSESLSAVEKPAPSERLPVGFSLIAIVQSTWSGRSGHLGGVDVDLPEVAEPVDAIARELDLAPVVPGRLELAELAPDHLVARARVAGHVDAAHVDRRCGSATRLTTTLPLARSISGRASTLANA